MRFALLAIGLLGSASLLLSGPPELKAEQSGSNPSDSPAAPTDEAYRTELPDWLFESGPLAEVFGGVLFPQMSIPERYRIEQVEHRRPGSSEPTETASVQMILDFHEISYDDGLAERITVRKRYPNRFIAPRDLKTALKSLPVETQVIASWDPYADDHEETWGMALRIIKASISLDLPVLIGYRPEMEIETPDRTGVAVGYNRRNIRVLEPFGAHRPIDYDLRDFKFMFAYAMILVPVEDHSPDRPVEQIPLDAAFLNEISSVILDLPQMEPELLTRNLQAEGFRAILQDINRVDFRDRLGKTRGFARGGGLPLVDTLLDRGRIAIIPQEYRRDYVGFALIYGRVDRDYAVVLFSPERTFSRRVASRGDLARRWLNRTNRIYRLDLIHVVVPGTDHLD